MRRRYPVPRPTENKALAAVARHRGEPAPGPVLLACLSAAYAAGDRHGVRLLVHVIARREEAG